MTTKNKISYFGFYFDGKSTLCDEKWTVSKDANVCVLGFLGKSLRLLCLQYTNKYQSKNLPDIQVSILKSQKHSAFATYFGMVFFFIFHQKGHFSTTWKKVDVSRSIRFFIYKNRSRSTLKMGFSKRVASFSFTVKNFACHPLLRCSTYYTYIHCL